MSEMCFMQEFILGQAACTATVCSKPQFLLAHSLILCFFFSSVQPMTEGEKFTLPLLLSTCKSC